MHLVTNDYHMTRSELIFRKVFGDNDPDNYNDSGVKDVDGFSCRQCKIVCHPCGNAYEKYRKPRALEERPVSLDQWFLSELMEIEINATKNLNNDLMKYNVSSIDKKDIEKAIEKLQKLYQMEIPDI